jgi:transketolase
LSCIDILMTLYHDILEPKDRFVLSKGHSAGALYTTLWTKGLLTDEDLRQFHKDETLLPGHPPANGIPSIEFATGSLGHGLGLAAGLALAKRIKGEPGRVFCIMSDGEWNEGSTWEALIFLSQQKLDNVTFIVDLNGLQGFGRTADIADLGSLHAKLTEFGVETTEVDGHDTDALAGAMKARGGPRAVLARTKKGNGVSFMEDRFEWHYLPLTKELYEEAVQQLQQRCENLSAAV